jgi:hypothetical protein
MMTAVEIAATGFVFSDFVAERTRDFTGRDWVFAEIDKWLADSGGSRAFLLVGGPGTGKSAILARLVQFSSGLDSSDGYPQLAPGFLTHYHFCQAQQDASLSPTRFVEALSLALAARYQPFAEALVESRQGDKQVVINAAQTVNTATDGSRVQNVVIENLSVGSLSARTAFDMTVRQPLEQLCSPYFNEAIVIVVDSLDEARTWRQEDSILSLLGETLDDPHDLPPQVRLVLACRPDERVLQAVGLEPSLDLLADAPADAAEVEQYATVRLERASIDATLGAELARRLGAGSGGNFLYARYIVDGWLARPTELSLSSALDLPAGLKGIYREFLKRELARDDEKWEERYQPLLGLLAVARGEGLTSETLVTATGKKPREVDNAMRACAQYLAGPQPEGPFRIYHQSFRDFLLESKVYRIYPAEAEELLGEFVWKMWQQKDRTALSDYVAKYGAAHLAEAGRLVSGPAGNEYISRLAEMLMDFNWLRAKVETTDMTSLLADFELLPEQPEAMRLLYEALRLSAHVLARDSAQLPSQLWGRLLDRPENEMQLLLEKARDRTGRPWLRPQTGTLEAPGGPLVRTLAGHTGPVNAMAVTADGRFAVSGSYDKTLKVWELETGRLLATFSGGGAIPCCAISTE